MSVRQSPSQRQSAWRSKRGADERSVIRGLQADLAECAALFRPTFGALPESFAWMERVKGIEPSSEAWEAPALPLSYTRAPPMISNRRDRLQAPCRRTYRSCTALRRETHEKVARHIK